jgi:hypothetical protein
MKKLFTVMLLILVLAAMGCSGKRSQNNTNKASIKIYVEKSGQGAKSMIKVANQNQIEINDYDEYVMPNEMGGLVYYYLFIKAFDATGNEVPVIPEDVSWACSVPDTISPETGNYNIDFHPKTAGDYTVTAGYHGESVSILIKAIPNKALIVGQNWLGSEVMRGVVFANNSPTDDANVADLYLKAVDGDFSKFELIAPGGIKNIGNNYLFLKDIHVNPSDLDMGSTTTGYLNPDVVGCSYSVRCRNGGFVKLKTAGFGWGGTSAEASVYYLPI